MQADEDDYFVSSFSTDFKTPHKRTFTKDVTDTDTPGSIDIVTEHELTQTIQPAVQNTPTRTASIASTHNVRFSETLAADTLESMRSHITTSTTAQPVFVTEKEVPTAGEAATQLRQILKTQEEVQTVQHVEDKEKAANTSIDILQVNGIITPDAAKEAKSVEHEIQEEMISADQNADNQSIDISANWESIAAQKQHQDEQDVLRQRLMEETKDVNELHKVASADAPTETIAMFENDPTRETQVGTAPTFPTGVWDAAQDLVTGKNDTSAAEVVGRVREYVHTVVAAKVDNTETEEFQLTKFRKAVTRLIELTEPMKEASSKFQSVIRWENKTITSLCYLAFNVVLYYDLLVTGMLLGVAFAFIGARLAELQILHKIGLDIFVQDAMVREPAFSTKASKDRHARAVEKESSKGVLDMYAELRDVVGPMAQMWILDIVDIIERIQNLLSWKRPARAKQAMFISLIGAIAINFTPARYVLKGAGFFVGLQIFVLIPLQSHYPRYRRLFSVTEWLLWDVPTDAEFAIEQLAELETESMNTLRRPSIVSATISQASVPVSAPVTARDVPIAAAHKESIPITESSIDPDPLVEEHSATWNGTKGALMLHQNSLQYHVSKISKVVHKEPIMISLNSIAKFRKCKSRSLLSWHGSAIELTLDNGDSYTFGGLSKRDEFFHRLHAFCGGKWKRA